MNKLLLLPACLLVSSLLLTACSGSSTDIAALAEAAANAEPRTEVNVVADGMKFDTDTIVVRAGATITLTLDNRDNALHNVAIYSVGEDGRQEVFRGEIFTRDLRTETFTAPAPGVYLFRCDAHPDMDGAFIAR